MSQLTVVFISEVLHFSEHLLVIYYVNIVPHEKFSQD